MLKHRIKHMKASLPEFQELGMGMGKTKPVPAPLPWLLSIYL